VHVFDQGLRSRYRVDLLKEFDCVKSSTHGMSQALDTNRGLDGSHRAGTTYSHSRCCTDVESKSATDLRFAIQTYLAPLELHELAAYSKAETRATVLFVCLGGFRCLSVVASMSGLGHLRLTLGEPLEQELRLFWCKSTTCVCNAEHQVDIIGAIIWILSGKHC
jgi:hypothetical protein